MYPQNLYNLGEGKPLLAVSYVGDGGYSFQEIDKTTFLPIGTLWSPKVHYKDSMIPIPPYEPAMFWWQTASDTLSCLVQPADVQGYAISQPTTNGTVVVNYNFVKREVSAHTIISDPLRQVQLSFYSGTLNTLYIIRPDAISFYKISLSTYQLGSPTKALPIPAGHLAWSWVEYNGILYLVDQPASLSAPISMHIVDLASWKLLGSTTLVPSVRKPMLALSPDGKILSVLAESLCSDITMTTVILTSPFKSVTQVILSRETGLKIESGWNYIASVFNNGTHSFASGNTNLDYGYGWGNLIIRVDNKAANPPLWYSVPNFTPGGGTVFGSDGVLYSLGFLDTSEFNVALAVMSVSYYPSAKGTIIPPSDCGRGLDSKHIPSQIPFTHKPVISSQRNSSDPQVPYTKAKMWIPIPGIQSTFGLMVLDPDTADVAWGCQSLSNNNGCYYVQYFDTKTRLLWLTCQTNCILLSVNVDTCASKFYNLTNCPANNLHSVLALHNWPEKNLVVFLGQVETAGDWGWNVGVATFSLSDMTLSEMRLINNSYADSGTRQLYFPYFYPGSPTSSAFLADVNMPNAANSSGTTLVFDMATGETTASPLIPLNCFTAPEWTAINQAGYSVPAASVAPGYRGSTLTAWDMINGLCRPKPLDAAIFTPDDPSFGGVDPFSGLAVRGFCHEGLLPFSTLLVIDPSTGAILVENLVTWMLTDPITIGWVPR